MIYAIQIKELTKKIREQTILKEILIAVKGGEIYGFLGANGAGNVLLIKLLNVLPLLCSIKHQMIAITDF